MKDVEALLDAIKPLMAGHHPATQGVVLAQLLSIWLAGHPAEVRESLLEMHLSAMRECLAEDGPHFDKVRAKLEGNADDQDDSSAVH